MGGTSVKKTGLFLYFFVLVISFTLIGCQNKSNYGKLYDANGALHYEGELKGGKPNGKGKAYDKGVLFFDGNFKDGKPDLNGYTKTYWDNGKLMFDGYYKDGERIEGFVYKEDGNLDGYLSYPPITIIGQWVGTDATTDKEIFYNVKFLEDGTFTDDNNKTLGTYTIKLDDSNHSQGIIKISSKSTNDNIEGKISFYTKNKFIMSSNSQDAIIFIRKGTDGYNK